ncbi:MAG: carbonic anhydrase family protein [Gammaproteobacteria bacterium]|jgi:carbonic anhydrase|nr:carbonic anhydrase family protein [Gammaproteobacteria bacterium]
MIKSIESRLGVAILCLTATSTAFAGGAAIWSYEGATGPENWGQLAADWDVCSDGRYQSPIDIRDGIDANLGDVKVAVKSTGLSFGLDGPTFAVPYEKGSWFTINNTRYELQQFHFHHPSEHTLNGKQYPMEGHMVLKSEGSDHADAVMGVFIEVGDENPMLKQIWNVLPRSNKASTQGIQVNVATLLPASTEYYMYEGSMTTPACPQGVRWFVMENAVQASQGQIDTFIADLTAGTTNNRPLQMANGRAILKGK